MRLQPLDTGQLRGAELPKFLQGHRDLASLGDAVRLAQSVERAKASAAGAFEPASALLTASGVQPYDAILLGCEGAHVTAATATRTARRRC